jgi:hypothetical protein
MDPCFRRDDEHLNARFSGRSSERGKNLPAIHVTAEEMPWNAANF